MNWKFSNWKIFFKIILNFQILLFSILKFVWKSEISEFQKNRKFEIWKKFFFSFFIFQILVLFWNSEISEEKKNICKKNFISLFCNFQILVLFWNSGNPEFTNSKSFGPLSYFRHPSWHHLLRDYFENERIWAERRCVWRKRFGREEIVKSWKQTRKCRILEMSWWAK